MASSAKVPKRFLIVHALSSYTLGYICNESKQRQRGKVKEENTQIENRRTHTADRNLQTDRQTDKRRDRKIEMTDKQTKTCHRKLKLLSQLAYKF